MTLNMLVSMFVLTEMCTVMLLRTTFVFESQKLSSVIKSVAEALMFVFQVETFSGVYKKLTGKDVVFEFPEFQL